jgi:phosphonate transport system substrate-binding protein
VRKSAIVIWMVIAILVGLACGRLLVIAFPKQASVEPLIYVDIPAEDSAATLEHWQPLMDYLSEQLGREVKMITVTDYAAVVEALKYGHADIARFGPSSYILAESEVDMVPIISVANPDGSLQTYQSYLIVRHDSGITSPEQLEGATIAYADIGSTSGYLLPATYFKKNDIELGEIYFAGGHPQVIEAVKNGQVQAGSVASNRWQSALDEGVISESELDIIWKSAPIPRGPTVVRADMPVELREAITEALLNAPPDIVAECGLESDRFGPAPPDVYEPIREIQKYLGLVEE